MIDTINLLEPLCTCKAQKFERCSDDDLNNFRISNGVEVAVLLAFFQDLSCKDKFFQVQDETAFLALILT